MTHHTLPTAGPLSYFCLPQAGATTTSGTQTAPPLGLAPLSHPKGQRAEQWPAQLEGRMALWDSWPSAWARLPAGVQWILGAEKEVARPTPDFLVSWFCPSCPTFDAHDRSASFPLQGVSFSWCVGTVHMPEGQLESPVEPRHSHTLLGVLIVPRGAACLWLDCGPFP